MGGEIFDFNDKALQNKKSGEKKPSNSQDSFVSKQESGKKAVHDGHRNRVRRRFLKEGLQSFEQHEMLEMLLFHAIPRKDTNPIAHELIRTFGSISNVLHAPVSELEKVEGVTRNAAILIAFSGELIREYYGDGVRDIILNTTEKMGDYIRHWFIGEKNERILLVCMDNKCKALHCGFVSEGSVNATEIHVRRILEQAIVNKASAVVLAHNHPNGFAIPSVEDQMSTRHITDTLSVAGIELVDHLVFADGDYVSMRSTSAMAHLFTPSPRRTVARERYEAADNSDDYR